MPEYRAPGVYVEETSFRSRSIEGVGTTTAGLIGPTADGPASGVPRVITSYIEFERVYGPAAPLAFGSGATEQTAVNDTALAARAFFDNGGRQLFVSRVIDAASAARARLPVATAALSLQARHAGSGGNYQLELFWHGDVDVPPSGAGTGTGTGTGTATGTGTGTGTGTATGTGTGTGSGTGTGDAQAMRLDLEIRRGPTVLASINDLSLDPDDDDFIGTRLADAAGLPVIFRLLDDTAGAATLRTQLLAACDSDAMQPDAIPQRFLIQMNQGTNGNRPGAVLYRGGESTPGEPTGLVAFDYAEDIFTVLAPSSARLGATDHQAVVNHMLAHCHKMRYRLALVDGPATADTTAIQTFRNNFSDDRLVLYYPWVTALDPAGGTVDVPPSGYMAGVYARNDVERGVHKAPANTVPFGALRFTREINAFQQELLNPRGINCLRSFTNRGHRVWGARTLGSDPNWKYVNVRRYFLYLERSIELSTQWAVFEPNGTMLWDSVRESIEDFLYNEWVNGRLLGGDPKQAYFVRCDRTTMTQNDIDNGRLVCLIGVAPLTPAEFVIFRIGQKTADA
jgi:hypothetical protein